MVLDIGAVLLVLCSKAKNTKGGIMFKRYGKKDETIRKAQKRHDALMLECLRAFNVAFKLAILMAREVDDLKVIIRHRKQRTRKEEL